MLHHVAIAALTVYVALLLIVARRQRRQSDNDLFFRGKRRSPWWLVAFGMIGASVSGVSVVSVTGWVRATGMTYLQMCAGFFAGYVVIACLLLPLYYRLRLTSIYSYLSVRYGPKSHRTGALFFLLSKLTGASARLFLACMVLHELTMASLGLPFWLTVVIVLAAVFFYTQRGGIYTLVRTDALQTLCLLVSTVAIIAIVAHQMHLSVSGIAYTIAHSEMGRVFCWDANSTQYFWRQFVNGMFITIVMTGLDQDMMQKNLTCPRLRDAQKDMCVYGACFLPVNLLFLTLGVLLYSFAAQQGIALPEQGDRVLPFLINSGVLGIAVVFPFTIGIASAALSSADSAMTSLTTSICVDLLDVEREGYEATRAERVRRVVHIGVAFAFAACIALFWWADSGTVIDTIYRMAGYTYGPLLGMFVFGMACQRVVRDRFVPLIALLSPILCAVLDYGAPRWWNYHFSYELLLLNGALTTLGLWLISSRKK
ncbi:MAG: sodium:solute symporter [Bacteroidaceae bacterium]|nr:sodium:solute symporter [Bacteroidaceae bacterium]